MVKKAALHLISLVLVFLSALIFITCAGYYTLIFDWNIPALEQVINAGVIILSMAAAIAIYAVAEKLKATH